MSKTQGMSAAEEAFHTHFLGLAIEEARAGQAEGGIPIGSVLVRRTQRKELGTTPTRDSGAGGDVTPAEEESRWSVADYEVVGRGHNKRVQKRSATLHAEIDCLEAAGRLAGSDYARCILYSTLSPCSMCSGAALLYSIPVVVMGENATFQGPEAHVRSQGVRLINLDSAECRRLMTDFIAAQPALWNEDIGV
jgi:cytosine deaminase